MYACYTLGTQSQNNMLLDVRFVCNNQNLIENYAIFHLCNLLRKLGFLKRLVILLKFIPCENNKINKIYLKS